MTEFSSPKTTAGGSRRRLRRLAAVVGGIATAVIWGLGCLPRPAVAQTTSSPDYTLAIEAIYTITDNELCSVTLDSTLTYLRDQLYINQVETSLGYREVTNLTATFAGEPAPVSQSSDADGFVVAKVSVPQAIVGKGNQLNWQVSFLTGDVVNRLGNVWEVAIPKLTDPPDSFDLTLVVPTSLGDEIYVTPPPQSRKVEADRRIYHFGAEDLTYLGVDASFGYEQVLGFELHYQLDNTERRSQTALVPLPPSIFGRQEVKFRRLEPRPEAIRRDEDGNDLAVYTVAGRSQLSVLIAGEARVVNRRIHPDQGGSFNKLPAVLVANYTNSDYYWPVDDPKIKDLAAQLASSEANVSQTAQTIFNYVAKTLKYGEPPGEINRRGALAALTDPTNCLCTEFTDLLVTLVRAAGIPAREINGLAITEDRWSRPLPVATGSRGEVGHSWPEFYDPNLGWIQVDPTWSATSGLDYFTKLDSAHLTLLTRGNNQVGPILPDQSDLFFQPEPTPDPELPPAVRVKLSRRLIGNDRLLITNPLNQTLFNVRLDEADLGDLLPGEEKILTGDFSSISSASELRYQDFVGRNQAAELIWPRRLGGVNWWLGGLLGIGLCVIVYKKLASRPDRRR